MSYERNMGSRTTFGPRTGDSQSRALDMLNLPIRVANWRLIYNSGIERGKFWRCFLYLTFSL